MKTFVIVAALAALFCSALTDVIETSSETFSTTEDKLVGTRPHTLANPCLGQPDGTFYADPYDCAKYYECLRNQALELTCGEGTWWNQVIKTCDYPSNVNCTVTGTTTSRTTAGTSSATTSK